MLRQILLTLLIMACPLFAEMKVLIVSNSMGQSSQEAKFAYIAREAKKIDLEIEYKFAPQLKNKEKVILDYDLVFFDALSGSQRVKKLVEPFAPVILKADNKILPLIKTDNPYIRNINLRQRNTLYNYWTNGGVENFQNMLKFIKYKVFDNKEIEIKEPNILPMNGIYHPNYKGLAFSSIEEYFKFLNVDIKTNKKPIIALYFGRNNIVGNITHPIDDAIRMIEKKGGVLSKEKK